MGQLQSDRSLLQELLEQLPEGQEDARERIEQLAASYETVEDSLEEVAQQRGVEGVVSEATQQAQVAPGQAAKQAQDVAGTEKPVK